MKYIWAILIFLGGELILLLVFEVLKKKIGPEKQRGVFNLSTLKGIFERLTIITGLLLGFPQILIAFGALKIGTRLHEEKESEISNNYFLIGNLISILAAMLVSALIKHALF